MKPVFCALLMGLIATAPAVARPVHAPHAAAHRPQTGVASYYRSGGHARTASGERFNPHRLTAASRTLPLGAVARVTNHSNGRSVQVTVTDRGPYAHHRIMDVSPRAAHVLDMTHDGVAKVTVTPVRLPEH